MDEAARQLALVKTAICSGLSNCVFWRTQKLIDRCFADNDLRGYSPDSIVGLLRGWVQFEGGAIVQKAETRENWKEEFAFVYEVLISVEGLPRELFVELVLYDDDEELPEVAIVSCHLTSFP